jgi:hypothetical protein
MFLYIAHSKFCFTILTTNKNRLNKIVLELKQKPRKKENIAPTVIIDDRLPNFCGKTPQNLANFRQNISAVNI